MPTCILIAVREPVEKCRGSIEGVSDISGIDPITLKGDPMRACWKSRRGIPTDLLSGSPPLEAGMSVGPAAPLSGLQHNGGACTCRQDQPQYASYSCF